MGATNFEKDVYGSQLAPAITSFSRRSRTNYMMDLSVAAARAISPS